jgi:hypothetical protein
MITDQGGYFWHNNNMLINIMESTGSTSNTYLHNDFHE